MFYPFIASRAFLYKVYLELTLPCSCLCSTQLKIMKIYGENFQPEKRKQVFTQLNFI